MLKPNTARAKSTEIGEAHMSIKDRLKEYHYLVLRIERMEHRVESLLLKATSPPVMSKSVIGRSGQKTDPMGDLMAIYIDEATRVTALTKELYHETAELEQLISSLHEPHRSIIEMRYLDLLPWDQVSHKCGYAKTQMMKFHAEALEELERKGANH
jgi:hypothetical protein